jgi:hypothetical protein
MSVWTRWLKKTSPKTARRRTTRPVRRPLGLVRLLEDRTLPAAAVLTDQSDYAPGGTALITATNDGNAGANFQAGETVQFREPKSTWDVVLRPHGYVGGVVGGRPDTARTG